MAVNVRNGEKALRDATGWTGKIPKRGPSPGVRDIVWRRPVFAGDVITYRSTVREARRSKSKPGWGLLVTDVEGINQNGEKAISLVGTVFIGTE